MASSVWDPGSQMALIMKFPVASWGCSTRWSDTEPVLLNVSTWQSCTLKRRKNGHTQTFYPFQELLLKYVFEPLHYLEATHSQVVFITRVSSQAEDSEGHRCWGQACQSQFPLTGVSLLQEGRQLQDCNLYEKKKLQDVIPTALMGNITDKQKFKQMKIVLKWL